MGCRLTRTESVEICEKADASPKDRSVNERKGLLTNGQSVLLRRDTPQQGIDLSSQRNGNGVGALALPNKPIGEVESASQADFFRMLDDKIQNGPDFDSELED